MEQKYNVIHEIKNIKANVNGKNVFVDIPAGTICTEENYGRGQTIYVYCTINNQDYHDIPFIEKITNGGRRKKKTKKRRTTKKYAKRHHKTRRPY